MVKIDQCNYHKIGSLVSMPPGSRDNWILRCIGHSPNSDYSNESDFCVPYRRSCTNCSLYNTHYCYKKDGNSIFGPCDKSDRSDGLDIHWVNYSYRNRSVGEIFIPRNGRTKLIVRMSRSGDRRCNKCFYYDRGGYRCNNTPSLGRCDGTSRSDNINVIFEKITDTNNQLLDDEYVRIKVGDLRVLLCSVCPYESECSDDAWSSDNLCIYKVITSKLNKSNERG